MHNFGRELVFSADLYYNGGSIKASPFGRGGGVADGEGKSWREYPLSPAIAGALPKGEPKDARSLVVWDLPCTFVIQRRNWR